MLERPKNSSEKAAEELARSENARANAEHLDERLNEHRATMGNIEEAVAHARAQIESTHDQLSKASPEEREHLEVRLQGQQVVLSEMLKNRAAGEHWIKTIGEQRDENELIAKESDKDFMNLKKDLN